MFNLEFFLTLHSRNGTIKLHCCDNYEDRNGICVGKFNKYLNTGQIKTNIILNLSITLRGLNFINL